MKLLAIAAVSLLSAGAARAQSPYLRATDTRTTTPENVMGGRALWGADASLGGSFTRGNTDIDYVSSGFDLFKAWAPATAYLSGSFLYNAVRGNAILNQGSLTARVDHPLQGPWKAFAFNTQGYNEFIKLDYRETLGAGPWVDFDLGPLHQGASLALAQQYEHYQGHFFKRSGRFSLRDMARLKLSPVAELSADVYLMPRIDDFGDSQIYAEISLQTLFYKDLLGIKVSWIDEYESLPRPGTKDNDIIWLTALSLRLGK